MEQTYDGHRSVNVVEERFGKTTHNQSPRGSNQNSLGLLRGRGALYGIVIL